MIEVSGAEALWLLEGATGGRLVYSTSTRSRRACPQFGQDRFGPVAVERTFRRQARHFNGAAPAPRSGVTLIPPASALVNFAFSILMISEASTSARPGMASISPMRGMVGDGFHFWAC
jgi:hypothetical protein